MKAIIYKIISPSGKFYVGSTTRSLTERGYDHRDELKRGVHHCISLQRAYKKYGTLTMSIIEEFEYTLIDEVWAREQYYIDLLKPEYNSTKIVRGGNNQEKPIIAKSIETGEEVRYDSGAIAARTLGINPKYLSTHIHNPTRRKSVQGYVFKYEGMNISLDDKVKAAKTLKEDIQRPKKRKEVVVTFRDGTIENYSSVENCIEELPISKTTLHRIIKGIKSRRYPGITKITINGNKSRQIKQTIDRSRSLGT